MLEDNKFRTAYNESLRLIGGIKKEYEKRIPQQLFPKGPVVNSWNI
jgi:hypothetical protein